MSDAALISAMARSLAAGYPDAIEARTRLERTLGRPWRWILPLAQRFALRFHGHTRPRHRDIVSFLRADSGFAAARLKYGEEVFVAEWIPEPQRMQPVGTASGWQLPIIETEGDLAAWLGLRIEELQWFADLKAFGYQFPESKLWHYRYRVMTKRTGGIRIAEIPKPRLKELQRRILHEILDRIPVHSSVHGFVKGRSIVSFAAPHTGKPVVLRLDLQDFFPTFPAARVQSLFRTLGYPESVADLLGGITTNAVPRDFWAHRPENVTPQEWREARTLYSRPHLPQGAPTSPALANLTAYRLDRRLAGLARTRDAQYTRYADDLAFSGGEKFGRSVQRLADHVAAIALEEGFHVNFHKTRIMRRSVRQQLAGIVVNDHLSVRRGELETLEAMLVNCARRGPESQNRNAHPNFRAHLEGRVGFVEMVNREKGRKLRRIFEAIAWPGET